MIRCAVRFALPALATILLVAGVFAQSAAVEDLPLVQSKDLVYSGAFRVPNETLGTYIVNGQNVATFAYGGTALAFNAAHKSLFIVGHDWGQLVAELAIPELRTAAVATGLATARVLQPFSDVTRGQLARANPGDSVKIGGLLPFADRLYVSAYGYYDGSAAQRLTHFVTSADLRSTDAARGPYAIGSPSSCGRDSCAGYLDGYFALVPDEWQSLIGAPVATGNCCLNVVSRTSYGPALYAVDPLKIGEAPLTPAAPLVYYTPEHPLSAWDSTSTLFNGSTEVKGVVFPPATRSVLFFGRQGTGTFCYGFGTTDETKIGTPFDPANPSAGKFCQDPTGADKGTHAYPYIYQVWAYDALDLAAARAGRKRPWNVRPYATWPVTLPITTSRISLNGAAYDPETRRLFVSQAFGDGSFPVIHVFQIRTP